MRQFLMILALLAAFVTFGNQPAMACDTCAAHNKKADHDHKKGDHKFGCGLTIGGA